LVRHLVLQSIGTTARAAAARRSRGGQHDANIVRSPQSNKGGQLGHPQSLPLQDLETTRPESPARVGHVTVPVFVDETFTIDSSCDCLPNTSSGVPVGPSSRRCRTVRSSRSGVPVRTMFGHHSPILLPVAYDEPCRCRRAPCTNGRSMALDSIFPARVRPAASGSHRAIWRPSLPSFSPSNRRKPPIRGVSGKDAV
jgi:hypothetical protein